MQSRKVTDDSDRVDAQRAEVGPIVGYLDGLGSALVEMYEAGAAHPIKTDLLDQVVSIIQRKKTPDERVREIVNLMRYWRRMPGG